MKNKIHNIQRKAPATYQENNIADQESYSEWETEGFSLDIMNLIFHRTNFKPILAEPGFNFGKLLGGMGVLFLAGAFTGYFTAFVYNGINRNKVL